MTRPSWQDLNAYVDGELGKARAAEIADAAAGDRQLAGEIAQLMKAKSGVSAAGQASAPDGLRVFVQGRERRFGWRAYRRPAMAAALTIALLGGGAYGLSLGTGDNRPSWFQQAQAIHAGFAAKDDVSALKTIPATAFALEGKFVLLPDLAAGELTLVALEAVRGKAGVLDGVAAHYRGNRGCQLTLIAMPHAPVEIEAENPRPALEGDLNSLAWRDGEAGYLLLGSGMDPARFGMLAEKIQAAAKEMRLFTPDEEQALAQSRANSVPCSA